MVAGARDDDLLDLWHAVGCLDKVFQSLLGREASHGEQVFTLMDAVLVKERCRVAAGHGVDAVRDKDALAEGSALFHLILVDKDDAVAAVERDFLALSQQPARGGVPLAVLVVGAVVGQHHGQTHQAHQRGEHARPNVVDVHHVGAVEHDVHHAQEGVPHGLKALDAGRGQVDVLDVGERLRRLLCEVGAAAVEAHLDVVHVGIKMVTVSLNAPLDAREAARPDHRYRLHSEQLIVNS